MTRKRRGRHTPHRSATRRPTASREHRTAGLSVEDQPLVVGLRRALRAHPVAFLVEGGMIAQVALERVEPDAPGWVGLLDSFLETDIAEITAVLHLVAALTTDELLARRIRDELGRRRQPLSPVITQIAAARATEAWILRDELGEGESIMVGVEWPSGDRATVVAHVDHTADGIAKDVILAPESIDVVVATYVEILEQDTGPDRPVPIDPADARARIEQALAALDGLSPEERQIVVATDDELSMWPQCRPIVELLVAAMPTGGAGYAAPAPVTDAGVAELAITFLGSPEAEGLADSEPGALADLSRAVLIALTFARDAVGDPLRWSPFTVDLLCAAATDPDDPMDADDAAHLAEVLPGLIRWAHRERQISVWSTAETLDAFEELRDELDELSGLFGDEGELGDWRAGLAFHWRQQVVAAVGSVEAAESLDDAPLPDEPLDLSGLPDDLHAVLVQVSGHIDRLVDSGDFPAIDVEIRTACRRFLRRVAEREPAVLLRRAGPANTAAAVVWVIVGANELGRRVLGKELWPWFGIAHPGQRASVLRTAYGSAPGAWYAHLGSPEVLIGARRAELNATWDRGSVVDE